MHLKTLTLSMTATSLAIALISFPKEAYNASVRGLTMWWEVVFPSLLPFFIVSELLISFGVVTFLGALLEPIMRPLFRVPGTGGFVWAMGMASGFPAGAKLTVRLRQEGKLSKTEAERLVTFTNASNPLFIFGAISVGFFHDPKLGFLLAACHYGGNLCVGLIMRFHGSTDIEQGKEGQQKHTGSLRRAFQQMHEDRLKDGRPIGKVLGDGINSSVKTLLMIGGFIILFSVLNEMLQLIQIQALFASLFAIVLSAMQISNELSPALISGLFEITLGSQIASETNNTSIFHQVIITSFIIGFSGFSVQAQVASILSESDIQFRPYFFARILHGFIASLLAVLLYHPLYTLRGDVTAATFATENAMNGFIYVYHWLLQYGHILTTFTLVIWVILFAKKYQDRGEVHTRK
nr:sporulation integral membrane protein YlbJ [Texcoconibacillus texcoconensis]